MNLVLVVQCPDTAPHGTLLFQLMTKVDSRLDPRKMLFIEKEWSRVVSVATLSIQPEAF